MALSERDVDYFRVEMSSAGTLTAYTTGSTDTEGAILDSSGTVLDRNSDGGAGYNFGFPLPVSAGTYYIEVEGWRSSTGDYTLHVVGPWPSIPSTKTNSTLRLSALYVIASLKSVRVERGQVTRD